MTVLATRHTDADHSPVRVRRAPVLDPPFDDELPGPPAARSDHTPGTATPPLGWSARGPRPQRPVTPRPARGPAGAVLAMVPGSGSGSGDGAGDDAESRGAGQAGADERGSGAGRPPSGTSLAEAAAQRFLKACVEVLNGHRPVAHLRAVTAPGEVTSVTDQLVRRTTRTYLARQGAAAPTPHRVRLLRLHTSEPRDGVAEVAAVLAYGAQTWAMAARLERRADTWLCTLLQVI